jgi:chromosome segregation ATPase
MARPGVSYHDVAQAAETLRAQGRNPTVDRVLAVLGTGSKSTLAPLLKQWKVQQGQGAKAAAGLPETVVSAVKDLHDQLQQRAEHAVAQAREEFQGLAADLKGQLRQAEAGIDALQADNQAQQERIQTLEADNADLKGDLEQARLEAATRGTELGEVRARLSETQARLEEQGHDLRQVRGHFEHYQDQMAEDRQRERDQGRQLQQQLEGRLQSLSEQLNREVARSTSLEAAQQAAEQASTQCRQALDRAQQAHQARVLEVARQTEAIKGLAAVKATLEERIGVLEVQRDALVGAKGEWEAAHRLIEQQLATVRDQVRQRGDENKRLAQAKARLEGQLKQLQGDL